MIGLLQMRPIPSHQTKGGGVATWGGSYDFECLCFPLYDRKGDVGK